MAERGSQRAWATRTAHDRLGSETRALLVEKAAEVFAERGYANTTIADITVAAGVSRATCYVYFASKDEVFQAVAERLRDLLLAAHELPDVDVDDLHEVLRRSTFAFFEIYAAHAMVLRVIEHQALIDPVIAEIWTETRERPLRRTVRFVQRVRAAGHCRVAGSARAVAEATIAVIVDFAHRYATGTSARGNRRTAQDALAMCVALIGLGEDLNPSR